MLELTVLACSVGVTLAALALKADGTLVLFARTVPDPSGRERATACPVSVGRWDSSWDYFARRRTRRGRRARRVRT